MKRVALAHQIRSLIDIHKKSEVNELLTHDVDRLQASEQRGLLKPGIRLVESK